MLHKEYHLATELRNSISSKYCHSYAPVYSLSLGEGSISWILQGMASLLHAARVISRLSLSSV
jgi:hypothetical protein